ncbi:cystathionine gamma-lyase-like [Littorina saxatilis]|uniref:cystathionine gamma-lyase-like n=1 Tax=Littorina saxatilis TaxID=31220 RepID=UPI0038B4ACAA
MGGHSDLVAGCVTTRTLDQWRRLKKVQGSIGACLSPHDCSLLLRGLKTLPIRMKKHSENAQRVAEFLSKHPKVLRVSYPGLPDSPGHEVAKRQMTSFSGMIMADIDGGYDAGKTVAET